MKLVMARLRVDLRRKGGRCVGMGEQKDSLPIRCAQRHRVIHKNVVVNFLGPIGGDDVF